MLMTDQSSSRSRLLDAVHIFVSETGMSENRVGRLAVGDGKLIARLRAGKDLTTGTLARIYAFMAAERARRRDEGERPMRLQDGRSAPAEEGP